MAGGVGLGALPAYTYIYLFLFFFIHDLTIALVFFRLVFYFFLSFVVVVRLSHVLRKKMLRHCHRFVNVRPASGAQKKNWGK